MAQNGTAVQQSRSRSGLLVAKEMLDDKLSDDGKVSAKPFHLDQDVVDRPVCWPSGCSMRLYFQNSVSTDLLSCDVLFCKHFVESEGLC